MLPLDMFRTVNADKTCVVIDGWMETPQITGDEACLPELHLQTKLPII
jgi:hypothetical protein